MPSQKCLLRTVTIMVQWYIYVPLSIKGVNLNVFLGLRNKPDAGSLPGEFRFFMFP